MKSSKYYLMMLTMIACIMGFVSCGSDDDDESESENVESIVGTWRHNMSDGGYYVYVFNADGSGYYQEYDEGRLHTPDMFSWMYNQNTKVVKMVFEDEENYVETWTIKSFGSKTITIIDEDGYEETLNRQ